MHIFKQATTREEVQLINVLLRTLLSQLNTIMNMDNRNINDASHDRKEWWEAKKAEHEARLEKMDAEKRLAANDAFKNFSEEFDAATDWTAASWDQFKAKVSKWWNEGEIEADKTI